MQVFELYFNPRSGKGAGKKPKQENDTVFESFCYEPENIYEKNLGSIYMAGEIKNVLPQNLKLLEKISKVIKDKYYSSYLKLPEGALKESLKALNDFLAEELKRDNTSWLGNIGLIIISLTPREEPWVELNFTKIGDLKILLLKDGQISDIGVNLKQEIEPYPLKVFSSIISGKISDDNVVAVFTKEAHDFFQNKNLVEKIAAENQIDDKKIKEILKPEEQGLSKAAGLCLLIQTRPEAEPKSVLAFQEKLTRFPHLIKIPKFALALPKLKIPNLNIAKFNKLNFKAPTLNKNLILVCLLVSVLTSGFLFAQSEKRKKIEAAQNILLEIDGKIRRAENFLILKNEAAANTLFQDALDMVLPLTKKNSPLPEKAVIVRKKIEENLNILNKLEEIEEPKLIFEFDSETGIIPYKMALSGQAVYFYNPLSSNVYKLETDKEKGALLKGEKNIQFGVPLSDSVLFFTKPNSKISLNKNDEFQETNIELPDFTDLTSFKPSNVIYFLESETGEIIKYWPATNRLEPWLKRETKKAVSAKSIAVDGSIWVLTNDNQISRYRQGALQETLQISIFPQLNSPTKIWTDAALSNIYILEPPQNRLVIFDKTGKMLKQYQSKKFNNLLDFAVSSDGKTIYLLNGKELYRLF